MHGWLIYNGSQEIEKISILIQRLKNEADMQGYSLDTIKSNDVIPFYDNNSKPKIEIIGDYKPCDYVIFWDKDIFLAKHMEKLGYKLFNSSDAIAKCDDKLLMHQSLAGSGIRIPKTIIGPFAFYQQRIDKKQYEKITSIVGNNFIMKEGLGSFGMQVYAINSYEEYLEKVRALGNKRYILQENIISSKGRDIRVNIIGNTIIGAMERSNSTDFRANITLGGTGRPVELNQKQKEIALKAHRCLGLDFSGLDLLYGDNDEPILCEVNSNVNYVSYEQATGINFSKMLLEYVEGQVK